MDLAMPTSLFSNMQRLMTILLILGFVSPCSCVRWRVSTQTNTYNVIDYGAHGDGKSDDSEAFLSAWKDTCGAQQTGTLVIPPKGEFLLNYITLNGPCNAPSVNIQLQGKIVAAGKNEWIKVSEIKNPKTKGLTNETSNLIVISNVTNLSIDGSGGSIDGYGSTWWNCQSCERPTILRFKFCNDLTVSNLTITNSPKAHIRINSCENATFSDISIRSPGDSPNTDGFDIYTSKNILIQNSTIQCGDDCIAISGGSSNISATGIACGPGHGISIGSLGRNKAYDTVEEVLVKNCTFTNTENGARIKTVPGGSGYARNITFENITIIDADNPIIIDQYYDSYGKAESGALNVSDVIFRGFSGTSAKEKAITLNCCPSGCFDIVLDHVDIVSSKPGKPASCSCNNAHGKATNTVPECSLSS
ncbi:probable polygalacturonase At3g15720 [Vigna radiata var. radiata]|uniref:Probable polygalacturonase At3g15720 n=1 Tax=Vigna radiata var. radiata TaxID=3916 RepID=A0A1S3VB29_VIGRR|nr:probable polygalacturonase At3g15720 [Vigna radiata var. radiata]